MIEFLCQGSHTDYTSDICPTIFLKRIKPNEYLEMDQEATKTHEMLQYATKKYGHEVNSFLLCFVQKTEENEVLHCMVHEYSICYQGMQPFLQLYHLDVMNYYCPHVMTLNLNIPVHGKLEESKHWGIEISQLLKLGIVHDVSGMMVSFCRY